MAKQFDVEDLNAMAMVDRYALYENALKLGTPEARDLIALMSQHKLLGKIGGGLPRNHPVIREIEAMIRSPQARTAAADATVRGLPALAGVDPMIQARLGEDYGDRDTTSWAGTLQAEVMYEEGYEQVGKRPMPRACVAKTAAFFAKK
ncbi:MAG TPA: hypothetical protein VFE13_20505 [Caulobacteraceae bacterium]|jgi:hypothetical protein|nr:hypothetical protein [Caulobacteraceae bacterium]